MKRPFTLEEKYEIEDVNGDACSIQNERDSAGSKPEPGPLDGYYGLDKFRNNIVLFRTLDGLEDSIFDGDADGKTLGLSDNSCVGWMLATTVGQRLGVDDGATDGRTFRPQQSLIISKILSTSRRDVFWIWFSSHFSILSFFCTRQIHQKVKNILHI